MQFQPDPEVSGDAVLAPSPAPPSEYRRALLAAAMRGLRYDADRVEIDRPAAETIVAGEDHQEAFAELARGRTLLQQNAVIQAIAAFTKAVLLAPEEPTTYEGLGTALLAKRKHQEAAAAFRTALSLDPDSIEARSGLADARQRQGRLEEAIAEWGKLVRAEPTHARAHARLAAALYYTGDDAAAWEHVHAAEALGQDMPPQFRRLLADRMPEP